MGQMNYFFWVAIPVSALLLILLFFLLAVTTRADLHLYGFEGKGGVFDATAIESFPFNLVLELALRCDPELH